MRILALRMSASEIIVIGPNSSGGGGLQVQALEGRVQRIQ
jgi:hypothetical protein